MPCFKFQDFSIAHLMGTDYRGLHFCFALNNTPDMFTKRANVIAKSNNSLATIAQNVKGNN